MIPKQEMSPQTAQMRSEMPTEPVSLSTPPGDTNIPEPIIEPAYNGGILSL
jgi:hypothetical protein